MFKKETSFVYIFCCVKPTQVKFFKDSCYINSCHDVLPLIGLHNPIDYFTNVSDSSYFDKTIHTSFNTSLKRFLTVVYFNHTTKQSLKQSALIYEWLEREMSERANIVIIGVSDIRPILNNYCYNNLDIKEANDESEAFAVFFDYSSRKLYDKELDLLTL